MGGAIQTVVNFDHYPYDYHKDKRTKFLRIRTRDYPAHVTSSTDNEARHVAGGKGGGRGALLFRIYRVVSS